jgi:putative transposase
VRGDFGEVEIETPRDRNGRFEPKIVAKRQTSVGNFSEAVISLYARGLTTREIEQHVKDIYGVEISPQFVSRVTEELQQQITEWQSRPLERVYPIIFVDGLRVAVRTDKGVLKKCVYTVLGVSLAGKQEVLGLWIEETEGARFWLKVFNDLKARGTQDVLIVCGDGLTGLRQAVESVFPQADVQLCVVHHIRNVTNSFPGRIANRCALACVRSTLRQLSREHNWHWIASHNYGKHATRPRLRLGAIIGMS